MLITAGFLEHHQDLKYRLLGMKAYGNGEFEDAMRYFRRAGYFADKPSQGMIGEMYWTAKACRATARSPTHGGISPPSADITASSACAGATGRAGDRRKFATTEPASTGTP